MNVTKETLRQTFIRDCVRKFKKDFPDLYQGAIAHSKEVKNSRATPVGADKRLEMRFEFTIPSKLFSMINYVLKEPGFLKEDSEARWFRREFPEFAAQEKW